MLANIEWLYLSGIEQAYNNYTCKHANLLFAMGVIVSANNVTVERAASFAKGYPPKHMSVGLSDRCWSPSLTFFSLPTSNCQLSL